MKSIKNKTALYILCVVTLITSGVVYLLKDNNSISVSLFLDCISASVTVSATLVYLFSSVFWKWKIFSGWLVLIPNLNGDWNGNIISTWGERGKPIPTSLKIKQSLFSISCIMETSESKSNSITCDIIIESNKQQNTLFYSYLNTPKLTVREVSPMHYGSVILEISNNELKGDYWTDRKTTGSIVLVRNEN